MPKKTPPPFTPAKARKGQAIAHMLISVDLNGHTQSYELGPYALKNLSESVDRFRSEDDHNAEVYYVPIAVPIPKKPRPVKRAKATAKKIAKPKQKDVDTKQEAPKKRHAKKTRVMKAATPGTPTPEPSSADPDGF